MPVVLPERFRLVNPLAANKLGSVRIQTRLTEIFGIRYPLIAAPMFLVSNEDLVVAVSDAGGIGTFPALNFRPVEKYQLALKSIKARTKFPIGVNIIVNQSNARRTLDLKHALDNGVELLITSLGNPKEVIAAAHQSGAKVFCDVTNLEHAKKVEDLGADGLVAVAHGAGGHAGNISPLVLIPWLAEQTKLPVLAAGGIANGRQMAACLALGAAGVYLGTRFIASTEAQVSDDYKKAIVDATPEDIVMTSRISGTPAAVIRTPYVEKVGTDLPWIVNALKNHPQTKKYVTPLIHWLGMLALDEAANKPTWKNVWSAGQSVGLINEIKPAKAIVEEIMREYFAALNSIIAMNRNDGRQKEI